MSNSLSAILVEYFHGHVASTEGASEYLAKIEAINGWKTRKSVTEARSFHDVVGFYLRCVEEFSKISTPLIAHL